MRAQFLLCHVKLNTGGKNQAHELMNCGAKQSHKEVPQSQERGLDKMEDVKFFQQGVALPFEWLGIHPR